MKRIAAYLLAGFGLANCAESVPNPTPSPVGKWEQLTVHKVFLRDRIIGLPGDEEWVENEPDSVLLEFTANGSVNLVHNGVAKPTGTTYTYQGGRITFYSKSLGETVHPVTELSDHRLVYHSHTDEGFGTEDVTFTYQR